MEAAKSSSTGNQALSKGAKSPAMQMITPMLILTLLAGGGGSLLGLYLPGITSDHATVDEADPASNAPHSSAPPTHAAAHPHGKGKETMAALNSGVLQIKELPPIVTNLAEPASRWIRIQVSIVFDPKELAHPDVIMAQLTSDIVGYLRTVTLPSIEGVNGLRRLHEELSDRASVRSNGAVRELIILSLVVQ